MCVELTIQCNECVKCRHGGSHLTGTEAINGHCRSMTGSYGCQLSRLIAVRPISSEIF